MDAPPPHTIDAAADDLVRLGAALALPVAGVMGHSFGGKVALAYTARAGVALEQAWVLDASLGTYSDRAGETESILRMLRAVPDPLPSRERFLEIVAEHGYDRAIAEWLALNVRRSGDGFRLRLDLDAIESLLASYHAADLWPLVEHPEGARSIHVVVAGRSEAFSAADRERLAAIAAREPRVLVHLIPGAGHWVHVDAPDALFALVRGSLEA